MVERQDRGDQQPIRPHNPDEEGRRDAHATAFRKSRCTAGATSWSVGTRSGAPVYIRTTSHPFRPIPCRCRRKASRNSRRQRFRRTAERMLRETENPTFSAWPKVGSGRMNRRTGDWAVERPSPITREKARYPRRMSALRNRRSGVNTLLAALVADGELFAALCTAPRKDFSAILRRHSLAESVFVAPLSGVRLIRTLHGSWLLVPNKLGNIKKNRQNSNRRDSSAAWPTNDQTTWAHPIVSTHRWFSSPFFSCIDGAEYCIMLLPGRAECWVDDLWITFLGTGRGFLSGPFGGCVNVENGVTNSRRDAAAFEVFCPSFMWIGWTER